MTAAATAFQAATHIEYKIVSGRPVRFNDESNSIMGYLATTQIEWFQQVQLQIHAD